jgi:hypothetical protein
MASLKQLGQVTPAATTVTALYTTPTLTVGTTVSSVFICNTNATPVTFRLSSAKAGAADAISQYIYYDVTLDAKDTYASTTGIALAQTDVLRCYASAAGVNFTVFGVEE